jgi:hypothetical protein
LLGLGGGQGAVDLDPQMFLFRREDGESEAEK